MTDKIKEQILYIRQIGKTNMSDVLMVKYHFILAGARPFDARIIGLKRKNFDEEDMPQGVFFF